MAQIKIYGERGTLSEIRARLSEILHETNRTILGLPADKRFHRFIGLDRADFLVPSDRGPGYIIIEISMFEGRAAATKKQLLHALMHNLSEGLGIAVEDIEITIFETPRANWGIRGRTGDELELNYKIET